MIIVNKSKRAYMVYNFILRAGEQKEIKDEKIIKELLKCADVEEVITKEEIEELKKQVAQLSDKPKKKGK